MKKLFFYALMLISAAATGADWSLPVNLSDPPSDLPQVGVDASGNAVAVWLGPNVTNLVIQSKRLINGVWSATVDNLSDVGQNADTPQVAVNPSGNAVAVWVRSDGTNTIIQSKRLVNGVWSATADNLSDAGQSAQQPQVAVDSSGNAVAVWKRFDGSNNIIQSKRLINGSWSLTADNLSDAGQAANNPQVGVDLSGNAVAVWIRYDGSNDIVQSKQLINGVWSGTADNLSDAGQAANAPQVAVDSSGNAVAVWTRSDSSNNIIQSKRLINGVWSATADNLSDAGQNADTPQVAVNPSGNAVAVWARSDGTNTIIQSKQLINGVWSTTADNLSDPGASANSPQVAVDSFGNAVAVWVRPDVLSSLNIIQSSIKTFDTTQWGTAQDLSTLAEGSANPAVAIGGDPTAVVVWTLEGGFVPIPIIQASMIELPAPIPTPFSTINTFSGSIAVNRFLSQSEIVQVLRWEVSAGAAYYEIRIGNSLVARVAAPKNQLCVHNQRNGAQPPYVLYAYNALGQLLDSKAITWLCR